MSDDVTANDVTIIDPSGSGNTDTNTVANQAKRVRGRPFAPGNNANPRGRPKKGESLGEKYVKRLEKDADELIEAHVRRAKGDNVVAERAFTTALAYAVGVPKQTFVLQRGDDPMHALMLEIQAAGGMRASEPLYIEAAADDLTHEAQA